MRTILVFVAGFGGGWAIRSLADSPQGVGVTLLRAAYDARERLVRWVAGERERLEDMMAEALAGSGRGAARAEHASHGVSNGVSNGAPSRGPLPRTQA